MTKITEHIRRANGKTLFSFEIIPPLKGESIQHLFDAIEPLMEFKPPFIDVTYHREEVIDKKHSNGLIEKVSIRKRPGTVGICARIMERFKVDAVPHVICGGFTKDETEDMLVDLHYLGIDNVLVLRGDPEKSAGVFKPREGGHAYASELLQQVMQMNKGILLHQETESYPTSFCTGIAGYPEKHFEAPNLETDFKYLKMKIDMGAEFIVTQMFFDNARYIEFVKKCRQAGILVPIIPGLKPLTTKKQLTVLPRIFHLDLPDDLVKAVEECKTDKEVKQVGIEWCIQQCKELIAFGAPVMHFYTMSKSDPVKAIAQAIF
ncbi:methylenetetrahydrofolate reductase [NAD(P)H] [Cytophagaceae bacterium YF14B1]|uniref:Methylenetetrahydrofolate reductase n=1 Tax=Xanthocytophaga flava TaxID=3048013 RepID=A0AAE3U6A9_9BACT|nr:methylenetetrahydrofolate reductase [NAD(P)H] [Xanthocytophaga flavus]MDJ1481634.1 methylenetetrahydrofolate reductase [NAD(P)H] [Xanthocytophaga flavus]